MANDANMDSVVLKIIEAKNLACEKKKDEGGCHAYLRLSTNFNNQNWKSKVCEKVAPPTWNQSFTFLFPPNINRQAKKALIIKVFGKCSFPKSDTLLGEAFFSLDDFANKTIWVPLENEPKKKKNTGHGEIQLAFEFHTSAAPQAEQRKMEDLYTIGKELGRGGFSIVYEGIEKATNKMVALKCVKKIGQPPEVIKLLQREISIMSKLKHTGIVELLDVFETPDYINMVLEHISGGELYDQIISRGSFTEKDAANVVLQLLDAALYMHGNGVAHRDLKPENLLMCGDKVKIADFGLSKDFSMASVMTTCCGSPSYVAPEVLSGGSYDTECDIWSIGVITYVLVSGYLPFFADTQQELFEKILQGKYSFSQPLWKDISDEAKDFIGKCLTLAPASRPSAQDCIKHPWIASQGAGRTCPLLTTKSIADLQSGFNPKTRGKQQ
eukprot:TRINITY_DN4772_c0_g1_i2.p1 TRINITY_DN4772_c0_g1~~TRINITY_DN4772_c0_g1_i2.p1  ORF type:complete len:468 (-),score=151.87 TRINITY_DN4772_c0_g1_i2:164-1483(-)